MTPSPRTGADVLAMVREALEFIHRVAYENLAPNVATEALARLDGCTLLTAEEADSLWMLIDPAVAKQRGVLDLWIRLTPTDDEPADSEWNEKVWAETSGPC